MGDTDILGILSIVFAFLFAPIGFVLGIIGIVQNRKSAQSITLPLIGLIISILPIVVFIFFIGIGSLAYSGVLNPEMTIPERCTFTAGIECNEYSYDASTDEFSLTLTNGLGRTIEVRNLSFTSEDIEGTCAWTGPERFPNGASRTFTLTDCDVSSELMRADASMTWVFYEGLETEKVAAGELYVRI